MSAVRGRSVPVGAVACVLLAGACAVPTPPNHPPGPQVHRIERESPAFTQEPWTFGSVPGRVLRTPSYRVFTTVAPGFLSDRVPAFVETALARYRTAFTPLPLPDRPLDTYVLANRTQWSRAAAQVLGANAAPYQQIVRGGITADARSVLYDIGPRDTFALLAHEGWHQFSQATFRDPLPIWLEEGIATVMEGFRWFDGSTIEPEFLAWCNLERFDQLRSAVAQGSALTLEQVLAGTPAGALQDGSNGALTYYAQVWALTMFLMEGDAGRNAPKLGRMVDDARHGVLISHIGDSVGPGAAASFRARRTGSDAFSAYFGTDLAHASREYAAFCRAVVTPGARERVSLGRSPLSGPGKPGV